MTENAHAVLARLGVAAPLAVAAGADLRPGSGAELVKHSPIDGRELARFASAAPEDLDVVLAAASAAFEAFRIVPAPRRGELVRRFGNALREHQADLASLVTLEVGKIKEEALGEVQEMVDICDFAVGQSRQLYGLTIASERRSHRLSEQWLPLGPIGVITAFNFPVAVWAWNAAIALVCGNPVVWKPSEKAPLTAMACHALACRVIADMPDIPDGILGLTVGAGPELGQRLAANERLPLISATGSVRMGRSVAQTVAARLGRALLELGGNNAVIVAPSADLELAVRSIVFSAVGTAAQRCTSLRRLIVHRTRYAELTARLKSAYDRLPIGNPLEEGVLVGPLIDDAAWQAMQRCLVAAREQGGRVHGGLRRSEGVPAGGVYVTPALVEIDCRAPILQEETFAPVLFVMSYDGLDEAIAVHNASLRGFPPRFSRPTCAKPSGSARPRALTAASST